MKNVEKMKSSTRENTWYFDFDSHTKASMFVEDAVLLSGMELLFYEHNAYDGAYKASATVRFTSATQERYITEVKYD